MVRKKTAIAGGIAALALTPAAASGQAFDEMRTDASTFEERYLKTSVPPAQGASASDNAAAGLSAARQALENADARVTADQAATALQRVQDAMAGTSFSVTADEIQNALGAAADVAADQDGAVTTADAAGLMEQSATSQEGIANELQRILTNEPQDDQLRDEAEVRPSGIEQILQAQDANEARNEIEEALRARLGTEENEIDALLDAVAGQDEPAFAPWTGAAPRIAGGGS